MTYNNNNNNQLVVARTPEEAIALLRGVDAHTDKQTLLTIMSRAGLMDFYHTMIRSGVGEEDFTAAIEEIVAAGHQSLGDMMGTIEWRVHNMDAEPECIMDQYAEEPYMIYDWDTKEAFGLIPSTGVVVQMDESGEYTEIGDIELEYSRCLYGTRWRWGLNEDGDDVVEYWVIKRN